MTRRLTTSKSARHKLGGAALALAAMTALAAESVPAQAASRFSGAPMVASTFGLPGTASGSSGKGSGAEPYQEAYDSKTGLLYIANVGTSSINVIYTKSATQASTGGRYPGASANSVVATLPFGKGAGSLDTAIPYGLTINSRTGRLLATSDLDSEAYMLNVDPSSSAYDTVLASYDFSGKGDRSASVNEAKDIFYLANPDAATVTVISGQSNRIVATYSAKTGPGDNYTGTTAGVAYDPKTNLLYTANVNSFGPGAQGTVSVLNASTGKLLKQINVQETPVYISYDAQSQRMFVANEFDWETDGSVSTIDVNPQSPTDNEVVATAKVGTHPIDTTVDASYGLVYVTNWAGDTVSVLDAYSGKLLWTVAVGNEPDMVQIDPLSHIAYADNLEDGTVSVIDPPPAPSAIRHSTIRLNATRNKRDTVKSALTLTARVRGGNGGSVQFYDDGRLLGQAKLAAGKTTVSLTTRKLAPGKHTLQAAFTSTSETVESSFSARVSDRIVKR